MLALLQSSLLAKTKVPVTTLMFPEEVSIKMSGIAICFCFRCRYGTYSSRVHTTSVFSTDETNFGQRDGSRGVGLTIEFGLRRVIRSKAVS